MSGDGLASATLAVKTKSPFAAGVPVIAPVPELSESPSGNLPSVIVQVRVPDPPSAAIVYEYAVPFTTGGSDCVATLSLMRLIVRENSRSAGVPP